MAQERTIRVRTVPAGAMFRLAALVALTLLLALLPKTVAAQSEAQDVDKVGALMGSQSFRSYCASCHGTEARGDGPVAEYLSPKPADLTQISAGNEGEFPFDEVFETIDGRNLARGHGSRDMPIWGDAFKLTRETPDDEAVKKKITDLVHFLRSIQEQ